MSTLSLAAQAALIGKTGELLTSEGLRLPVTVQDVKSAWGNVRYVIADTHGNTATVAAERVQVAA